MKNSIFTFFFILCSYSLLLAQQNVIRDYKYTANFETDKDQLNSHAKLELEKRLNDFNQYNIQSIQIVGHTDVRGSLEYNMDLSNRRTLFIQEILLQNGFGLFPISLDYKGEIDPKIMDTSQTALQINRRVEIWFSVLETIPESNYTIVSSVTTEAEIIPEVKEKFIPKPLTAYQQFHQQLDKDFQVQNLDNNNGGLLKGSEGTLLFFYPNSFCDCTSLKNINGPIDIALKEYYQLGDFINAGLNTRANNRSLQSAGTVLIKAFVNNEEVCLKKGQEYQIMFPKHEMNKEEYADMNLFTGNMDENGEVNWGVMKKNGLINQNAINFSRKNQGANCRNCGTMMGMRKLKFFVRCKKFFASHYQWKNYRYWRSDEGQDVARANNSRVTLRKNFCYNKRDSLLQNFKGSFEELVEALQKDGKGWEEYIFNYYITSSSKLNYINCDRFLKLPPRKLQLVRIPLNYNPNLSTKIILKASNSIMNGGRSDKGTYDFGKLPKGQKATFLAYDYSEEKPQLARMEFTIGKSINIEDLAFESLSLSDFKKQISTFN